MDQGLKVSVMLLLFEKQFQPLFTFSGGVVDMPALFTVDTCGETGALGFSIEGPSQVTYLKFFNKYL